MINPILRTCVNSFTILIVALIALPSHAENCEPRGGNRFGIAGIRPVNAPNHVYAGHTVDYLDWKVLQFEPYSPPQVDNKLTGGRAQTFLIVVNGSARPTKARLSAFNSSGSLVFEGDRCILPGRSSALMQSDLLRFGVLNAETLVISSDEPLLINSYATSWGQVTWFPFNTTGFTEREFYAKRNIDFLDVPCKKPGSEFFCGAALLQTPWKVDAGAVPSAAPWP